MKIYVNYDFYTDRAKFLINDPIQFDTLAEKASRYIDRITFGRLHDMSDVPEEVKLAVCAMVNEMYQADGKKAVMPFGIKSESADGYSIAYATEAEQADAYKKRLQEAVRLYLPASHPLRYVGVD